MSPHAQAAVRLLVGICLALSAGCRRPPAGRGRAVADPPSPAASGQWDRETRRFAVVIGSNTGGAERKTLRYAEHDAARLAAVLRELGSFHSSDLVLVTGPGAAATRRALGNLRTLVQAARRDQPGSRALALVYYSGHSNGRTLELGPEKMEFSEVQQALADTGADLRLLIVDACQSGAVVASKGGSPGPAFELDTSGSSGGDAILTSAAPSEEALESAELEGSFFSHHLLSGLRGAADANRDGRVDLSEAYRYAAARTVAETSATLYGAQHPSYHLRLSGQSDVALTELPATRAAVEVTGDFDRVLFFDALTGKVAGEWAGGTARRLALTPGPYLVKASKDGRVSKGRLTLAIGESRRLTAAMLDDAAEPATPPPATPPPAISEEVFRRTIAKQGECLYRCVYDPRSERGVCPEPFNFISNEPPRSVVSVELPSRKSLLRVRFEVCDPKGLWLNLADSPSCDGGGGDATQFSNDAELELQNAGVWLFGNDFGRGPDKQSTLLAANVQYVASRGCSVRTLVVADGSVRSAEPGLDVRSPYSLRLDPAVDHEGKPDRFWYLGFNRSVGSNEPRRSGSGLTWVEMCIQ
ncbi:MAG TPA: caspase family protein [Polyangia bacterium]|nr:caspase family protein [Polyangia bacterium]